MRIALAVFLAFLPLALVLGCTDPSGSEAQSSDQDVSPTVFANLAPDTEFVGDAACFDCHEDQYRGFYEHGMANSMYRLTDDVAVEDFGSEIVVDSTTGLHYEMVAADSGYFQIEYLLDSKGNRVHELSRPMNWVVGSGTSARTYLAENDGWFYELPVTWYTQQGRWDFSPGYRVANKRFNRKIADRCVVCHNSYPAPIEQTNGMYSEMPTGIGCERCHGPGAEHVEARLVSDPPEGEPDITIVNPEHLSLDRRLDVCQQCHLNGSVSLLRDGRTPYDFRPSESMDQFVSLYNGMENVQEEGISVISHADRMRQSACFIETLDTPRPMECTTCHDPHEGFRSEGDIYFNTTCMSCHGPQALEAIDAPGAAQTHVPEANCVDCHMPQADLLEAPHSAFTDHFIRVVGREEVAPETATDHDVLTAHFRRDRENSDEARLYEGMAYITRGYQGGFEEAVEKGIRILDEAFAEGATMSEAHYLHGYAHILMGRPVAAIPSLEEAVRLEPDKAERLNALAQAYEQVGGRDPALIERLYREALRIQPELSDIRINLGRYLQTRGRVDEAREAYRLVTESESWNALGWYNLGTLALLEANLDEAARLLERSVKLNPTDGGALSNLGLVYLQLNRLEEGRTAMEAAVERDADHPEAHDNLGSLYLNLGEDANAVVVLEKATRLNPSAAGVHATLALAYLRMEQYPQADESARRALSLNPSEPLAMQILQAL